MQLKYKLTLILSFFLFALPTLVSAQSNVMLVFPEDDKFVIPHRFLKNKEKGTQDSIPMKFLTLKYLFYNSLTQLLVSNNYKPIGGINNDMNTVRKYSKKKWFAYDSATNAKMPNNKYLSTTIDQTNKNYYNLYATADAVDYIIIINKVEVDANIFRRWFATKNYLMQVHFDVYDKNMKPLYGQYIRKKVRLTKSTFWSAFKTHFEVLPNELALYFVNAKK